LTQKTLLLGTILIHDWWGIINRNVCLDGNLYGQIRCFRAPFLL
jgi:hypothetical protein